VAFIARLGVDAQGPTLHLDALWYTDRHGGRRGQAELRIRPTVRVRLIEPKAGRPIKSPEAFVPRENGSMRHNPAEPPVHGPRAPVRRLSRLVPNEEIGWSRTQEIRRSLAKSPRSADQSTQMADKLIFISCGQLTDAEKSVGVLIKALVDATPGFKAYFAESVHDLDSLAHNVFDGIQRCAGAIVALRDRGLVLDANGAVWGHRSSVWVNQEVALLAYRQFAESTKLPILAFVDPGVKLEGAMTSLIVNPQPLPGLADLKTFVDSWLANSEFTAVSADS
jgi:hypothetical protein